MTLEVQTAWGTLIAIYLFLGGLGGACLTLASIAVYSKRILPVIAPWTSLTLESAAEGKTESKPNRQFTLAMSLSGVLFLAIGSLALLLDLLKLEAVIYLLSNPTSWIFWGTIFIAITLLSGAIYGWAQAAPYFRAISARAENWIRAAEDGDTKTRGASTARVVLAISNWHAAVGKGLQRIERPSGLIAGWFGFATAFYTGFLISMAPSIPLWHTPALPLLFLVSAFSTAAAYALVLLVFIRRRERGLEQRIEGFDVGLIIFEILILLAYFSFASMGSVGAQASVDLLLSQPGFWIGVLLLGLLVPLALELSAVLFHHKSTRLNTLLTLLSGLLVLAGGYLLRHYILVAGVFELPY